MPIENRSSSTEMVSVPREAVVQAADLLQEYNKCSIARDLRAILAQPAEQHEAEPVALPARKSQPTELSDVFVDANNEGWNACLDEIAKLGPLYSRPVQGEPVGTHRVSRRVCHCCVGLDRDEWCSVCDSTAGAEVERLRGELDKALEFVERLRDERETLRAQLADRDALLRLAYQLLGLNNWHVSYRELMTQIDAALSASAEHKPFRTPDCPECACVQDGNCLCIPSKPSAEPTTAKQETRDEMRIRHKREFDALDGSGFHYQECRCGTQGSYPLEVKHCVCGKAFASAEPSAPVDRMDVIRKNAEDLSSRLKNACCQSCMSKPCDCAIQSAPVEHDHDALVAAVCVLRSQGLGNLSEAVEAARAALERKP
ncbi:hypothetical protein JET72_04755 [Pseudomonas juntendi]|uniref:hypothetical protein n=1 Tax=Pseudomonas juntendi TaxID=2666183 RepID=UPI0018E6985C|nr:hypothetical protein [Pseudomonas juntendi]MBI6913213.1 hypothetical protein [Pseudomonas juntendi]